MKRVLPVLLLALAAAAPAPAPAPGMAVSGLLAFTPPPGWTRTEYANSGGADAVVAFESGADRIAVHLYGAPGSVYKTPAEFLKGPAATTMGRPPEKAGRATAAGRRVALYRHGVPLPEGDPHVPSASAPRLGTEVFCVLPPAADGRFLVLAFERRSPVPELSGKGEKAWKSFLKSTRRPTAQKP